MNITDFSGFNTSASESPVSFITQPVYQGTIVSEQSDDFIIPDYISDVKRAINLSCELRMNENYYSDGRIECSGEVLYVILLMTEDGSYRSVSFSTPYSKSEETSECSSPSLFISGKLDNSSCRLINPRKLNLRSKVVLDVKLMGKRGISPLIEGRISPEEESGIEYDVKNIQTISVHHLSQEKAAISEDIEIDDSLPAISEILYCGINMIPSETRLSSDHINVNSEAETVIVYTSDSGEIRSFVKHFPLSSSVPSDIGGEDYEFLPSFSVSDIKTSVQNNSYGERRIIELDFNCAVSLLCIANENCNIISDCYSTISDCVSRCSDNDVYSMKRVINSNFSVDAHQSRAELNIPTDAQALYTSASMCISSVTYDSQKNRVVIEGETNASMIYSGSENGTGQVSFTSPFKYETDCGNINGTFGCCMSEIKASNVRGRMDAGGVYCDLEAIISLVVTEKNSEHMVEGIVIDSSQAAKNGKNSDRPSVLLYYPSRGERLWDIAKKYNTTKEALIEANNLTGNNIGNERVILIPKPQKKAVYSKVI